MTDNQLQTIYPDISALLAAQARRRRELAALSWEAKVAIVEQMRQLLPRDAWKSRPASEVGDAASEVAADLSVARNTQYLIPNPQQSKQSGT